MKRDIAAILALIIFCVGLATCTTAVFAEGIPIIVNTPRIATQGQEDETPGGLVIYYDGKEWCRHVKDFTPNGRIISYYVCSDYALRIVRDVR